MKTSIENQRGLHEEVMKGCGQVSMRSSNIELLRIVAMLSIIAHHYVVNSTVTSLFDPLHPTTNQIFLQLWGAWGKAAINVFVLITGYFMCQSKLTARRYLKILLEIIFYSWIMWLVLAFVGYETITWKGAFNRLILKEITANQDGGFVPGFMWMYLLIPAMNTYLSAVSRKGLYYVVMVLLVMFSACGTLLNANVYHHVFWYVTLYLVGSLIRKYPCSWMSRIKVVGWLFVLSVFTSISSVLISDALPVICSIPVRTGYYFLADSHKLLAFLVAFFAFLTFKNWRVPQSNMINAVASTTFGVLLIHAATDGMRKWLWQDFVNVPSAYSMSLPMLVGYSVVVMVGVFVVCSALDYLRIRFVERPVFKVLSLKLGI